MKEPLYNEILKSISLTYDTLLSCHNKEFFFQQTVSSEWILNTHYALLFHSWEQVHEGNVAKKSAAELVLNTFYYGFKAKDELRRE